MSEPFDPYHAWLAIPPDQQPPNHYRLLGIEPFEADAKAIQRAAERRMAQLEMFRNGPRAGLCQRLLAEVEAAKACLLQPDKKAAYDRFLRGRLAGKERSANDHASGLPPPLPEARAESSAPVVELEPSPQSAEASCSERSESRPTARARRWAATASVLSAVGLIGAIVWLASSLSQPPSAPPASIAPGILAIDWPENLRHGAVLELNGTAQTVPAAGPVELPCQPGEVLLAVSVPGLGRVEERVRVESGQQRLYRLPWSQPPETAPGEAVSHEEDDWWLWLVQTALEDEDMAQREEATLGVVKPTPPLSRSEPRQPSPEPGPSATSAASVALPSPQPVPSPLPSSDLPQPAPSLPPLKPEPFKTDPRVDGLVADAWRLLRRAETDPARERLLHAYKVNRDDLRTAFSLGLVDALVGLDWDSAEKYFQQCVQEHPSHVASLNNLALVRLRLDKEVLVPKHWQAAMAQSPPAAEIVQNLGRVQYLIQKGRLSLKPATQKALESLYAEARARSEHAFNPSVGFRYMGLYGGGMPDFGWSDPRAYEDRWCVVCNGRGRMKCPEHDCVRGTVTRMASKAVAIHPMTKAPIYQSAPVRIPCATCRGAGWIPCIHCRKGLDKDLP